MSTSAVVTRIALGSASLLFWLTLFSCGLLMETSSYRRYFAPEHYAAESASEATPTFAKPTYEGSAIFAFVAATACYTPTNLVLITLLAGLVGGCASNVVAGRLTDGPAHRTDEQRFRYLEENPWSAMVRSFVVYLCVIGGLYFVANDPFKDPTPSQYIRLAGTLSVLAFVVGYDPSRLAPWMGVIPSPQTSQTVTFKGSKAGVEVTAAQGPTAEANANHDAHTSDFESDEIAAVGDDGSTRPRKTK